MAGRLGRAFGKLPTEILEIGDDYGVFAKLALNSQIMVNTEPRPVESLSDEIEAEQSPARSFVMQKFGGIHK